MPWVTDRAIADQLDLRLPRDLGKGLAGGVIDRITPALLIALKGWCSQVHRATARAGLEDRMRHRVQALEPGARQQESPAPVAHLGASGANQLRAIPDARICEGAKARADCGGRIAKRREEQIVESRGARWPRRLVRLEQCLEQLLLLAVVHQGARRDHMLRLDSSPQQQLRVDG